MEVWKSIKGYEGFYEVSTLGNVKSLDRKIIFSDGRIRFFKGKFLNPAKTKTGYLFIGLKKSGSIKQMYLHRIVAESFIFNKELKETVNHIDGNKQNNNLINLEWNTRKENTQHAYDTGLIKKGENGCWSKLKESEVLQIRNNIELLSNTELSIKFKVSKSLIGNIKRRKIWTYI